MKRKNSVFRAIAWILVFILLSVQDNCLLVFAEGIQDSFEVQEETKTEDVITEVVQEPVVSEDVITQEPEETKETKETKETEKLEFLLESEKVEMIEGEERQLVCLANPEEYVITWESHDSSIATVSEEGLVTALAVGEAWITVTAQKGNDIITENCSILVSPAISLFSLSGSTLYNQYIGVCASSNRFSIGTYEGNVNSTSDNNTTLLFGWSSSGTSSCSVNVDGNYEIMSVNNTYTADKITSIYNKNNVEFERTFTLEKSTSTGNEDVVQLKITATNKDSISHEVGGRIAMDTMVGGNDSAPFYIPGIGGTTRQTSLTGDAIPQYWQAFNQLTNPTVIAQGTLYRALSERPDRMQFGSYGNLCGSSWEGPTSEGSSNGDSAVAMTWYPVELLPGESRTFTTWLGVGEMTQESNSDITLSVTGDNNAQINDTGDNYNDITISAYLQNTSSQVIEDARVTLNLPETIRVANEMDVVQHLENFQPGETRMLSWVIQCALSEADTNYEYSLTVEAENQTTINSRHSIAIPSLDLVPPVLSGDLREVVYGKRIQLNWNGATDGNGIEAYEVYRDQNLLATVTECGYTDDTVETGKEYEYRVVAIDRAGNRSNEITKLITPLAPTVQGLTQLAYGGAEDISLSFESIFPGSSAGSSVEEISYKPSNDNTWISMEEIQKNIVSEQMMIASALWKVENLSSGSYDIKVKVSDESGAVSEAVSTVTLDRSAPSKVEGIQAIGEINAISLSWSMGREHDVTGYRIYRRVQGETEWNLCHTVNGRETCYYSDSEITNEINYEYVVTAIDGYQQESEYSDSVVGAGEQDRELPEIVQLSPEKNKILSGEVAFRVQARDNVQVDSVVLNYSIDNGETWVEFGSISGASGQVTLNTASLPDGSLEIQPIAKDSTGNLSAGNFVYIYYIDNTPPSKVTGLSYKSQSTVVTLSWKDVPESDLDHFLVQECVDGEYRNVTTVSTTLGANITNLLPETTYIYRVLAVDGQGNVGEPSDDIEVVTGKDTTPPVVTSVFPASGYQNSDIAMQFKLDDDTFVASMDIQVSTDKVNWQTVDTVSFSGTNKKETCNYVLSIADLEDGSIYVRGIPVDASGNTANTNSSVQYILDRVAPEMPTGLKVENYVSILQLKWNQGASEDIAGYRIYRSTIENGNYSLIQSKCTNLNYYDRTVEADQEYFYKIEAYDLAGNVSERSASASGKYILEEDLIKPTVDTVYPESGKTIGGKTQSISFLAKDNNILDYVEVTYGKKTLIDTENEKTTVRFNGNIDYYISNNLAIDMSEYNTGDILTVEFVAYDKAKNASDKKTVEYVVDQTAPEVEQLSAVLNDTKDEVTLHWNGKNETDLNGYYIYRKANTEAYVKIGQRAKSGIEYSFVDSNLIAGNTYTYKVVALDKVGNSADFYSESVEVNREENPNIKAAFTCDTVIQVGAECQFDASSSSADLRINQYKFDFGDNTTSSEYKPIHIYTEPGTYTVSLTITDLQGNIDTAYQTIIVSERKFIGTLKVQVVDDSGNTLSNAPVYFNMDGEKLIKYTDKNGQVVFNEKEGTYKVGSYQEGYLPVTKNITLVSGCTRETQLILVNQPIVTGTFETHRMTLEEIKEAGIDISDPANHQIIDITVHLVYGSEKYDLNFATNKNGTIVLGPQNYTIQDENGEDRNLSFNVIDIPDNPSLPSGDGNSSGTNKVIAIMDVPVTGSYLKEFFDVKLHIINNASSEYNLINNCVHLNVPEGMTIMPEGEISTEETTFDALAGQTEKTLQWILRGDAKGEYTLRADYSSELDVFDVPVLAQFVSDPIKVYGNSAVKLHLNINRSIRYRALYFDIGMENVAGVDLYMPSMSVMEAAIRGLVNKDEADEAVEEYSRQVLTLGTRIENAQGYKNYVETDPTALSSGESLYHEYAIYDSIQDDDVAWLQGVIVENLSQEGIDSNNIVITVQDMDLYEVNGSEDAQQKFDALQGDNAIYFNQIINGDAYAYFSFCDEENDKFFNRFLDVGHDALDTVLNLDFGNLTKEEEKEFLGHVVAEMMEDESIRQQTMEKIDDTYIKLAKNMVGNLKNASKLAVGEDTFNADTNLGTAFNVLENQSSISAIANNLKEDGVNDKFQDRLLSLVLQTGGAAAVEALQQNFLTMDLAESMSVQGTLVECFNEGMTGGLGEVSDILGAVSDTITCWNDATEAANTLMALKAAEEESNFVLDCIISQTDGYASTQWMCDEAKELKKKVTENCNTMTQAFANELQEALLKKLLVEGVGKDAIKFVSKQACTKVFGTAGASTLGGLYAVFGLIFNVVDSLTGWGEYYDSYDQMLAVTFLSGAFQVCFAEYRDKEDSQNALRCLKYLIKTRIIGERLYVKFIEKTEKMEEFQTRTQETDLDTYLTKQTALTVICRDQIYQTKASVSNIPEAPTVSINYKNSETVEKFTEDYEYSFNGGETWIPSNNNEVIKFEAKTISQILYVRKIATENNLSGNIAQVVIAPQERQNTTPQASFCSGIHTVTGLLADTDYEFIFSDNAQLDQADWSEPVNVRSDSNGEINVSGQQSNYVIYRIAATEDKFASVAAYVESNYKAVLTVKQVGVGIVACDQVGGYRGGEYTRGTKISMTVEFDSAHLFEGWYNEEGQQLSGDKTYEVELNEDTMITAKFVATTYYSITAQSENTEKGTVSGSGEYAANNIATVTAIAKDGYRFTGWYNGENLVSTNYRYSFEANANLALTAKFEEIPTTVKLNVSTLENSGKIQCTIGQESNEVTEITAQNVQKGSTVTLKANVDTENYEFMYWYDTLSKKIVSESVEYSFLMTTATNLQMVCKAKTKCTIVFKTSAEFASKILATHSVNQGNDVEIPSATVIPDYQFMGWDSNEDGKVDVAANLTKVTATEDMTYVAIYMPTEENYQICVVNGEITKAGGASVSLTEGSYKKDTLLTVTANAPENGQYFAGWSLSGDASQIISMSQSYSFYVKEKATLTALYSETEIQKAVCVSLSVAKRIRNASTGKDAVTLTVAWDARNTGYTVVKTGILRTYGEDHKDNLYLETIDSSVTIKTYMATSNVGTYTNTVNIGATSANLTKDMYAVGYVVYRDAAGKLNTVYTPVEILEANENE